MLLTACPLFAQLSEHDNIQDKELKTIDRRIDEHLEAASAILAVIETKLNIAIGVAAILVTGLLIPWVRRKIGIGLFIIIALTLAGCLPANRPIILDTSNKQIEVCQIPPCTNRCFTNQECHYSCYCNYWGYCTNKTIIY